MTDGRRAIDHLARSMIDLAGSIADPIVQTINGALPIKGGDYRMKDGRRQMLDLRASALHPAGSGFGCSGGFFLLLQLPHAGVGAAPGEQVGVMTALDDVALIEHDDLVGVHHGG